MSNKPVFVYWNLRGLGQSIRHLLHYLEMDYEEKYYLNKPDLTTDDWLRDKFNLGLQFPNCPYWIEKETGVKLTESRAILKHIAREFGPNLLPISSAEHREVDLIEFFSFDLHSSLIHLCYGYTKSADEFEEGVKAKLGYLSKFLDGRMFVTWHKNFPLYEVLYQLRVYKADLVDQFPKLGEYMKSFEALPQISKYMATSGYLRGPCFSFHADVQI